MLAAHHRHVAGVVMDAVLLLVGGLVLLVDDDQPELRGTAGTAPSARPTTTRASPDATPAHSRSRCAAGTPECHSAGLAPKRAAKRSRNCAVSAISGSRISTCRPGATRLGHRLEIDLGLARAGDAVEQRDGEGLSAAIAGRRASAAAARWPPTAPVRAWSGSGGSATGSGASATVSSAPSSMRPSITPTLTPAASRELALEPDHALLAAPRARARVPASCASAGRRAARRPGRASAGPLGRALQRHRQHRTLAGRACSRRPSRRSRRSAGDSGGPAMRAVDRLQVAGLRRRARPRPRRRVSRGPNGTCTTSPSLELQAVRHGVAIGRVQRAAGSAHRRCGLSRIDKRIADWPRTAGLAPSTARCQAPVSPILDLLLARRARHAPRGDAAWSAALASERRFSPKTVEAYARDLRQFLTFLTVHLGEPPSIAALIALKPRDIRAFLAARRLEGIGSRSLMRQLAALRSFARHLERDGHGTAPAFSADALAKVEKRLPRPLTPAAALAVADPDSRAGSPRPDWILARDGAVLALLYGAGLRISEALGLARQDAPITADAVTVTGKGQKVRTVPVIAAVRAAIEDYLRLCPYHAAAAGAAVRRCQGRSAVAAYHPARGGGAARRPRPARHRDAACVAPLASPPTCSPAAASCAPSRSCSATSRSRPRSCIRRSTRRALLQAYDAAHPRAGRAAVPVATKRR